MFSLQLHINVLSLLVTLVLSQAFNVQLIIWSDTQGNPHADLWSSLSMHLSVQSFWCSIKILASLKKKKILASFASLNSGLCVLSLLRPLCWAWILPPFVNVW